MADLAPLAGARHEGAFLDNSVRDVQPDPPRFSFDRAHPPVCRVPPGTTVRMHTSDAGYRQALSGGLQVERGGTRRLNALTGPVAVEGAEPGDALAVRIEAIAVGELAFAVYVDRWGRRAYGMEESWIEVFPIEDGAVRIGEDARIAVRPMIGCAGVAPAAGALSSLSPTGPTGGNMDLRELEAGATLWLPIQAPGALFSLGDLHAAMGIGEPAGAGLECAGTVTARLDVHKRRPLTCPRIETSNHLLFLGIDPDNLYEAKRLAIQAAWQFLTLERAVDDRHAFAICSGLLDLRFGGPAGGNVIAALDRGACRAAGVPL